MNKPWAERDISVPKEWDRRGLPGWTYHSPEFLQLEKKHIFMNHWQIVCHVSDVPNAGDYHTLDMLGERAVVVRGENGDLRAFRNMCRHRGSRVVPDEAGTAKAPGLPVPWLGL